jgi:hypothetical protein
MKNQFKQFEFWFYLSAILSGLGFAQAEETGVLQIQPAIAEVYVGERAEITIKVPAEVLAIRDIDIEVQSSSLHRVRFVHPTGALIPTGAFHFGKNGPNEQQALIQSMSRGTAELSVTKADGLLVERTPRVTVIDGPLKNPSFDSTPAPAGEGYGAISGWNGGSGINTSAGPFADNGMIPDRLQVAFQEGSGRISQEVHGLFPGHNYWLQFFFNARNCCAQETLNLTVKIAGKEVGNIAGIAPVGNGQPYHFQQISFMAESPNPVLEFITTATRHATLLLDAISIVKRPAEQVLIRNPSFEASGSVFVENADVNALAGWEVGGGSQGLSLDARGFDLADGTTESGDVVAFLRGSGASISQRMSGLKPGEQYLLAFWLGSSVCCALSPAHYSVTFGEAHLFEGTWNFGGGYQLMQKVVTATGPESVLKFENTTPAGDNALFIDNVVLMPVNSEPFIMKESAPPIQAKNGGFVITAIGAGALRYQWFKGETALPGENRSALPLEHLTVQMSGEYKVSVENDFGSIVSNPFHLTALEAIPGLYNTGVADDGSPLADGARDNHYALAVNPDNPLTGDAIVEDESFWPITDDLVWFGSNGISKWIGPRRIPGAEDPLDGPAEGDYVYRAFLDLAEYDASVFYMIGRFGCDDSMEFWVNGLDTGVRQSGSGGLSLASLNGVFQQGINILDFKVHNNGSSPTGLRIEDLAGFGRKAIIHPRATIVRIANTLRIAWLYNVEDHGLHLEDADDLGGPWRASALPVEVNGGEASSTVVITDARARFYRLVNLNP